ncbi:RNA-binding S4 domain-containing protein [Eremococcus coleocola]|uniref:RQC P-site tRNA stabilizing factor n=1 Tax=Eremococcus coleocola ACS-139-V-Col8 TaxID=908337 RepID=E4KMU0_9LACT|nr:RNA-binding S4 domain-containing protein [Eremococcus coleocola]EFR31701.1 S4 domain protein [Eremococcus coleocola ACS-139-V-Col8]
MRLDKFLKVSRLIKRRSVAKEVADQGRVLINDIVAKSSATVKVGDEITIRYGNRTLVIKVEALKDSTKKEDADSMYSVLANERSADEV